MDFKRLTIKQAAELVRQLKQEGIDCPNCKNKLSASNSRFPSCGYVLSKIPIFAITTILAGVAAAAVFLVVSVIGLF